MITKAQSDRILDDLKYIGGMTGTLSRSVDCISEKPGEERCLGCLNEKIHLINSACHRLGKDIEGMLEANKKNGMS